jgi:hypothetical protein
MKALGLLLLPAIAHADPAPPPPASPLDRGSVGGLNPLAAEPPPDPSAVEAGDSNLESISRRKGRNLTFALGGGRTIGFGVADAVGTGGSVSLRLAQVASASTLITVELGGVVLVHEVKKVDDFTTCATHLDQITNQDTNVAVGAQFYINRSLWIRGATGFGIYHGNDIAPTGGMKVNCPDGTMPTLPTGYKQLKLAGPVGIAGVGLELAQFKRWSLGIEIMSIGMLNREGLLSSTGVMIDAIIE